MSETNTFQADSGSTDTAARKADVMPTASDQIAQWLAEIESRMALHEREFDPYVRGRYAGWEEEKTRLRTIMESINAGKV